MSSTYEAAVLGAELVAAELGADRVHVVDTRTAAGAQGLVVVPRRPRRPGGATLDEVEAVARAAMNEVRLVACVPDLGYLVRSGRVPNIAGWAGRRLGLTPLFEFREAGAHPLRPAHGMDARARADSRALPAGHVDGHRLQVAVLHADSARCRDGSAEPGRKGAGPQRDVRRVVRRGDGRAHRTRAGRHRVASGTGYRRRRRGTVSGLSCRISSIMP